MFKNFQFKQPYLEKLFMNYCYLNRGLTIHLNSKQFSSKNGLRDFLEDNLDGDPLYPVVHLEGEDIEIIYAC